jgi:hypothetical protein
MNSALAFQVAIPVAVNVWLLATAWLQLVDQPFSSPELLAVGDVRGWCAGLLTTAALTLAFRFRGGQAFAGTRQQTVRRFAAGLSLAIWWGFATLLACTAGHWDSGNLLADGCRGLVTPRAQRLKPGLVACWRSWEPGLVGRCIGLLGFAAWLALRRFGAGEPGRDNLVGQPASTRKFGRIRRRQYRGAGVSLLEPRLDSISVLKYTSCRSASMTASEVPILIAPEAARTAILAALTKEVRQLERARISVDQRVSSGNGRLDAILPERGFRRATLVEWLGGGSLESGEGSGAATLALVAAREACRSGGMLVTVEPPGSRRFYPPAAAALGVVLERTIVVRPTNAADFQWAVHQALGCPGVAAVVCWTENLQGSASGKLDDRMFRRWQLAAEKGTSLGLLIRPGSVAGNPSWAEVQLRVCSLPTAAEVVAPRRLRVEVLRCRGGQAGGSVQLEIDPETGLNPEIGLENQRGLAYFAMPCEQNVPVPLARQS